MGTQVSVWDDQHQRCNQSFKAEAKVQLARDLMKGPEELPRKRIKERDGDSKILLVVCVLDRVKRRDHFKAEAKVQLASDLMKGPEDFPWKRIKERDGDSEILLAVCVLQWREGITRYRSCEVVKLWFFKNCTNKIVWLIWKVLKKALQGTCPLFNQHKYILG